MNVELLKAQYRLLDHGDLGWTEFRVLELSNGTNPVIKRSWVNNQNDFVKEACKLNYEYGKQYHLFVGINPRINKDVPSAVGNIGYACLQFVDIDPIRPKGVPSTNEQHQQALEKAKTILCDLPNSILVDSGSGAHIYIPLEPIKITDAEAFTENFKKISDEIKQKYSTSLLRIDSVFDLPRVTRVWGSWNHKSNRQVFPTRFQGETIENISKFEFNRTKLEISQIPQQKIIVQTRSASDERFGQLIKNNIDLKRLMNGEGNFPSRSEADFVFISILTHAQFTLEDIKHFAKINPLGRKDDLKDSDIERIYKKANNEENGTISLIQNSQKYFDNLNNRRMGYQSGFSKLDDLLSGFQKGKIYVLAARTNQGKTSFACHLAYSLVHQNIPVLFFPTELGYEPLVDKLVAQTTEISLKRFQAGNFSNEEKEKIRTKILEISSYPFIVKEDFALELPQIIKSVSDIAPGFIIVDYIQALKYQEGGSPREIGSAMRGLRELAQRFNVPVLVLSQLSRLAINNEITLAHIKGSGGIEEFADVVMVLNPLTKDDYPAIVDLIILKSRYSELGKVRLNFYKLIGKFEEKDKE